MPSSLKLGYVDRLLARLQVVPCPVFSLQRFRVVRQCRLDGIDAVNLAASLRM